MRFGLRPMISATKPVEQLAMTAAPLFAMAKAICRGQFESFFQHQGRQPGAETVYVETSAEVGYPQTRRDHAVILGEKGLGTDNSGSWRDNESVGVARGHFAGGLILDVSEHFYRFLFAPFVGQPVGRLSHPEMQEHGIQERNAADQIADPPSIMRNKQCRYHSAKHPSDDHPGHAEGDEQSAASGRRGFGEDGRDHRDAGTQAYAGQYAEESELSETGGEVDRYRQQRIGRNGVYESISPANFVRDDAGAGAADDQAEEAPGRQAARLHLVQSPLGGYLRHRIGYNHVIIAVEDHGHPEEEKHGPGKFVDSKRVYYFRDGKAFHLFILS